MSCTISLAQTEIISESAPYQKAQESFGPNRLNHVMLLLAVSQYLPLGEFSDEVNLSQSRSWTLGAVYKRKTSKNSALLLGIGTVSQRFGFTTDQPSILFATGEYEKELLKVQFLQTDVGFRLNFDRRRGNHLGHYFDFGFSSLLKINSRHIVYSRGDEPLEPFRKSKFIESGLTYLNPIHYGAFLRFGINRICLEYRYQASPLLDKQLIGGSLPSHQIGISTIILN